MATIDYDKLREYMEAHPEISAKFDAENAEKKKRLADLDAQSKAFAANADSLRKDIEFMQENDLKGTPAYEEALSTYKVVIAQRSAISREAVDLINPPKAPQGETVYFPDEDDPSGESTFTFPENELRDLVNSPEKMSDRLRELMSSEDKGSGAELKALTHMLGEDIIQQHLNVGAGETLQGNRVNDKGLETSPNINAPVRFGARAVKEEYGIPNIPQNSLSHDNVKRDTEDRVKISLANMRKKVKDRSVQGKLGGIA